MLLILLNLSIISRHISILYGNSKFNYMQLKIISSSSSGNSYLLTNGKETLVVEAGMPFKKVKEALNFDISSIEGCISTHQHL